MRKITLTLLILLSTQCFAAKNLVEVYILQSGKLVANQNNLNNGIPEKTALNEKYTVSYTYINQVAIPIQDFVPYFSEGFNAISNDCPSVLPIGGMCSIVAEYTPTKLGKNDVYMYLKEGGNLFYIPAITETYRYLGESKLELSTESTPFNTYYANPEVPNARYVFKNVGSNIATIAGVQVDGKPTQESYFVIDNCRGAALSPTQSCSMIFGGWLVAGVHQFSITLNYDGKQYVYSETVVVGDDKKVVGCKIG
jgi:hypothetical protein